MDPADWGVAEAAAHLVDGDLSALEYAQLLLDRVEKHRRGHAFITVRPSALLDAARQADTARRRGDALGPLHGVPLAIKDNIDTADLPTTGGTPALRDHRPAADARVVHRLRAAGALILGKANLHELAYGMTGANACFGPIVNPYGRDRIAGGSSGGTAAAVAARLTPAGLGTDTGGSVRIPASLCGVVGLRPTVGRYSRDGLIVLSSTRDTAGPLARSVDDVRLIDAVLAGLPEPSTPAVAFGRLGVVRKPFATGLAPDLEACFQRRLAQLDAAGFELVEFDFPPSLEDLIVEAGFPIAFYETPRELGRYLRDSGTGISVRELVDQCAGTDVREILTGLLGARAISADDYRLAMSRFRPELDALVRKSFRDHRLDALIWPTTPLTAAPIGAEQVELGGRSTSAFLAYSRTTNLGSILGWPGVSVPGGQDDAGLPIGIALDGLPGTDHQLLRIARVCEDLFGPLPAPRERR
ncbi:indoleacetamide hydrolase [Nocardia wallacei]|uniref:indoleacetamide hydrolase n=1 Tax=Nocardia wallacei TaxID=480035 RepID=UPI0024568C79|nr:indoleacetamide hydrolase [Nocardia wallacei]